MAQSTNPVWRFLSGRSRRLEYWPSWIGVLTLNAVVSVVLHDPTVASFISMPFWIVVASRRLHDFGRTGWWSLIPFGVGFLIGLAGGFGQPLAPAGAMLINLVASLGMALVIGVIPGSKGSNRFGPRPGAPADDGVSDVFG